MTLHSERSASSQGPRGDPAWRACTRGAPWWGPIRSRNMGLEAEWLLSSRGTAGSQNPLRLAPHDRKGLSVQWEQPDSLTCFDQRRSPPGLPCTRCVITVVLHLPLMPTHPA